MSVQEIFSSEKRNKDSLFDIHFYMEGSFGELMNGVHILVEYSLLN